MHTRTFRVSAAIALLIVSFAGHGHSMAQRSAAGLLTAAPQVFAPGETAACLRCHGMPNFAFREGAAHAPRELSVLPAVFRASAHGALACTQCHPDVTAYPHRFTPARRKATCADDCHAVDRHGKPVSHASVTAEFASSVHVSGRAAQNPDSPTCVSCHGGGDAHTITRAKGALAPAAKLALCVRCHGDEQRMARNRLDTEPVDTYRRSFHYKAIHFGGTATAVCQDCHTVHGVLPKDSARSSIAAARLPQTCGQKACHPGARMNFAMSGANHLGMRIEREPVLWIMENFFLVLTAGTMLMLVAGIILDVQRKFGWVLVAGGAVRAVAALARGASRGMRQGARIARKLLID